MNRHKLRDLAGIIRRETGQGTLNLSRLGWLMADALETIVEQPTATVFEPGDHLIERFHARAAELRGQVRGATQIGGERLLERALLDAYAEGRAGR